MKFKGLVIFSILIVFATVVHAGVWYKDNQEIRLGDLPDFSAYHDGTNTIFDNDTGKFIFDSPSTFTFGTGAVGIDYILKINGENNDFTATWDEDNAILDCNNSLRFPDNLGTYYGPGSPVNDGVIYFDGTDFNVLAQSGKLFLGSNTTIVTTTPIFTIGEQDAGVDYQLKFDGETNQGILTWMEDEDYFKFSDDILMDSTEKLQFNDTSSYINDDGTDLNIVTNGDINLASDINISGRTKHNSTTITVLGPTDDLDVGGVDIVFVDTNANNVTIGGFTNGVDGQILQVVIENASNNTTLEHNEGTGNQDMFLNSGGDETLAASYGGWLLICNGTHWYEVDN